MTKILLGILLSLGAPAFAELTSTPAPFTSTNGGGVPPSGGGTTNFLRADGTWAVPPGGGGGGTPGGSDTQVQFNDAGSFGGDAGLVYTKATDVLNIGKGPTASSGIAVLSGAALYLSSEDATGLGHGMTQENSSATANTPAEYNLRKNCGSFASPAACGNNDLSAVLGAYIHDGTAAGYRASADAIIQFRTSQVFTSTAHGTNMLFATTPTTASAARTNKFRIPADGGVEIFSSTGQTVTLGFTGSTSRSMSFPTGAPSAGQYVQSDGSGNWSYQAIQSLQGVSVDTAAPANNNLLTYNSTSSKWEPRAPAAVTGFANDTLSNLGTTAVNAALLSTADGTIDLGSSSNRWRFLYTRNISDGGAGLTINAPVIDFSNGDLLNVEKVGWKEAATNKTVNFTAGVGMAADLTFKLPIADGANGDCLKTNASGVLSFSSCGGGGGLTSPMANNTPIDWDSATTGTISGITVDATDTLILGQRAGGAAGDNTIRMDAANKFLTISSGNDGVSNFGEIDIYTDKTYISSGNSVSPQLHFYDSLGSETMSLEAPTAVTSSTRLILPDGAGSAGQALLTDGTAGAANLTWGTPNSPSGTVCGWYDVGTTSDVALCKGASANGACPAGYTQKDVPVASPTASFCVAN